MPGDGRPRVAIVCAGLTGAACASQLLGRFDVVLIDRALGGATPFHVRGGAQALSLDTYEPGAAALARALEAQGLVARVDDGALAARERLRTPVNNFEY